MSGGSYDYLCFKIGDAGVDIIQREGHQATRQIISKLLVGLGEIMHEVEWEDSGDGGNWGKVDKEIKKITNISKLTLERLERLNKYEMIEKIIRDK